MISLNSSDMFSVIRDYISYYNSCFDISWTVNGTWNTTVSLSGKISLKKSLSWHVL